MQVQSKSTVFAWWINYTLPERYGKKKKKRETKRCVLLTVFHFQKNLSLSTRSFQWNIRCFYKLVINKKKKKEKRNNSLCAHITRDKESNFHFCQRLISLVVASRGYDVFHGFPVKKISLLLWKMVRTPINKVIFMSLRWIFFIIFYLSIVTFLHSILKRFFLFERIYHIFIDVSFFEIFLFASNVKKIKYLFR